MLTQGATVKINKCTLSIRKCGGTGSHLRAAVQKHPQAATDNAVLLDMILGKWFPTFPRNNLHSSSKVVSQNP
jgi:hypothetical protein